MNLHFDNIHWTVAVALGLATIAMILLLTGCGSQSRSRYEIEGTVNGQPATFTITGVENTAIEGIDIGVALSTATAGLRGDIAGVMAQIGNIKTPAIADVPSPWGERGASIGAILTALLIAWSKHKDSTEGWDKAAAAQAEALRLAKALPPNMVP